LPAPAPCYERHVRWLVPFLAFVALACDRAPSDLRVWRASDHDHTTNPGADQVQGGPDAGTAPELAQHGLNEVTIVAWQQNCVRCHGRLGRGDGPQGVSLRATDFTNPAWQAAVTDEQLLKSIRDGKGTMPAFPLPETTLRPLVQLVRLFGRAATPDPAPSALPSGSAGRAAPLTSARTLPPGHPTLPPGHPTLPAGHPTSSAAPPLPAGHPPLPPGHATVTSRPALGPGHLALPAGHPPVSAPPPAPAAPQ
jgi:mono/diheme cytochrome c family protein